MGYNRQQIKMKKLMSLVAAIFFSGVLLASTNCEIPDGWNYYTKTGAGQETCTVVSNNVCGTREYMICWRETWYHVNYDSQSGKYYFWAPGEKITFNM